MVIGIIGSSFAGLIAGKILAEAGHEITVIEKNRKTGGRLASFKKDELIFDYGISSIISSDPKFESFMNELKKKGVLKEWASNFGLFDGTQFHKINPNRPQNKYHTSEKGLNSIAKYLSRWVDVKSEERAGGLTYIGSHRSKKRAWMINLTDISVFECDAVILATPAPQAYGVLQTAQDETPSRRIIRHIDEVNYDSSFALMATYEREIPTWKGIECEGNTLSWIGNESSKITDPKNTGIVIRSSASFARKHAQTDTGEVANLMLEKASKIVGPWLLNPVWIRTHFWKYFEPKNVIDDYFLEMEMEEAPLALIGDYFKGTSVQDAYLSGTTLGKYWANKFSRVSV